MTFILRLRLQSESTCKSECPEYLAAASGDQKGPINLSRRDAIVSSLGAALILGRGKAANASTRRYYYDANGRLVLTTADNAPNTRVSLDASDNRSAVNATAIAGPSTQGRLNSGQRLLREQSISSSPTGSCFITLQGDGNLVMYTNGGAFIWGCPVQTSNGVYSKQGAYLDMQQSDGNLVLYDGNSAALWASNTSGVAGAYLFIPDGSAPVVKSSSGQSYPL